MTGCANLRGCATRAGSGLSYVDDGGAEAPGGVDRSILVPVIGMVVRCTRNTAKPMGTASGASTGMWESLALRLAFGGGEGGVYGCHGAAPGGGLAHAHHRQHRHVELGRGRWPQTRRCWLPAR